MGTEGGSVPDADPKTEPYVFEPPGSRFGSEIISKDPDLNGSGSGSFRQQAIKLRKTSFSTVCEFLMTCYL